MPTENKAPAPAAVRRELGRRQQACQLAEDTLVRCRRVLSDGARVQLHLQGSDMGLVMSGAAVLIVVDQR
jgi:hypothetical protein